MSQQNQQPLGGNAAQQQPSLNLFGQATARLAEYGQNASNNLTESFSALTVQGWIRFIAIVGAYILLRPYLMKFMSKGAIDNMESEDAKARAEDDTLPHPDLTPNEYRGIKEKLMTHVEGEGDGSSTDWGQKARVRQRTMLMQLLEEDERRRAAQDEDADIQEFLED